MEKSNFQTICKLISWKVTSLSQFPPSKSTAALLFVTLCTKPLYPLYIELGPFTTTKEPGSIGLVESSINNLFTTIYDK